MRVLQVVTDTDRRGAQVFACDLHDALTRRSHEVETVALRAGTTAGGLELPVLGHRARAPRVLRGLRARMKNVDVTIAHGSTTGPCCAIAGVGLRQPFVYRQISDSRFWAPTRARRMRVRESLRRARLVVALSRDAADTLVSYIGVEPSRLRVVPNGVATASYHLPSSSERQAAREALELPDAPTLLFVGALVPEKGADLVLVAASRLPDAHVVVVGEGPERAELERAAERYASGRVHFRGWVADPVVAYHAADLLVLPSRGGDSMPATLIEAALCGVPSVSTHVGSIGEVVIDGTTGLLVDPGDVEALTWACERLIGDGELRRSLGEAGREHCLSTFDIDVVASAWEQVLHEAAGR
jgi:glycosyltransferase involved in cell wall biosynthesis